MISQTVFLIFSQTIFVFHHPFQHLQVCLGQFSVLGLFGEPDGAGDLDAEQDIGDCLFFCLGQLRSFVVAFQNRVQQAGPLIPVLGKALRQDRHCRITGVTESGAALAEFKVQKADDLPVPDQHVSRIGVAVDHLLR